MAALPEAAVTPSGGWQAPLANLHPAELSLPFVLSVAPLMHSKIFILDVGFQVTQLVARRVRDSGVFSEVFPYDASGDFMRNVGAAGVVLSGSHSSTLEGESTRAAGGAQTRGGAPAALNNGNARMRETLWGMPSATKHEGWFASWVVPAMQSLTCFRSGCMVFKSIIQIAPGRKPPDKAKLVPATRSRDNGFHCFGLVIL